MKDKLSSGTAEHEQREGLVGASIIYCCCTILLFTMQARYIRYIAATSCIIQCSL